MNGGPTTVYGGGVAAETPAMYRRGAMWTATVPSASEPAGGPDSIHPPATSARPVGGWVRFLSITMLVGPPLGLIQLGAANHSLDPSYFIQYPRLSQLVVLHTV